MKPLEHEDVVLFSTLEQLQEYIRLSPTHNIFPRDLELSFPQIQSKYWSFEMSAPLDRFRIKATALQRLIAYKRYKAVHGRDSRIDG